MILSRKVCQICHEEKEVKYFCCEECSKEVIRKWDLYKNGKEEYESSKVWWRLVKLMGKSC